LAHASPTPDPKPAAEFKPFIPADQEVAEFTPKAVIFGVIFGVLSRIAQRILALTLGMLLNALNVRPARALAAYDGR
jgi:hypothetical protein